MKRSPVFVLLFVCVASFAQSKPLSLHPDNPHYFLLRGKPTILITSGEHYGAVVNLDFDYVKYLDTLAKDKLNLTRTFLAYREQPGAFGIANNVLAPKQERFITPWARSNVSGYFDGGNKFDLTKWDEKYFARLKDFVAQASKRGIVIEANLFSSYYSDKSWFTHPFYFKNNINNVGNCKWDEAETLKVADVTAAQDAYVRKIVTGLKDFDNVYYEICNEPYAGGVTDEWQRHIADVIVETEKNFKHKHLISQNISNGKQKIVNPHPAVSIFNFHYAYPPDTVEMNYALNKVIGDNETGFAGAKETPYRMEGWDFIIAGGALFNNLDYSFTNGYEDGTFNYPDTQPGSGNPTFRQQLRYLRDFMYGFNFVKMKPDNSIIKGGVPAGVTAHALVEPGKAYAIYLRTMIFGAFSARWTGQIEPKFSEEYAFHTFSNDGVRLWINGERIINNWTDHGEVEDTGKIKLEAGKRYDLRLEYFYNGGNGVTKLLWSSTSQSKEVIQSNALFLPNKDGAGLKAEYFKDAWLSDLQLARNDATVDFAWGTKGPLNKPRDPNAPTNLQIELPAGNYSAEWIDPITGAVTKKESFKHNGGTRQFSAPNYKDDIALRIKAR